MHRIFCMKFGKVPPVTVPIVQEPMYVRSMRIYGRGKVINLHICLCIRMYA